MKHPRDKQLVAHAMGFGDPATSAHLQSCSACQARLQTWQQPLTTASQWPAADPDPTLVARICNQLAEPVSPTRDLRSRRWVWSAALATGIALTLAAWLARPRAAAPVAPSRLVATAAATTPLLRLAVGEHLDQAQILLLEVKHAQPSAGAVAMRDARDQARELLATNRLYAADASAHGDLTTAHVLGLLEPPLLEIAHSPDHLDTGQWRRMNARFASSDLLFKLRVFDQTLTARRQARNFEQNGDL